MQIWTNTIPLDTDNNLIQQFFTEDTLFFDIETTGFSPAGTQLYLIGCARRCGDEMIIEQYFAETFDDETAVLTCFLTLLEKHRTIITFNGSGFDIPYIKAKCRTLHLPDAFSDKNHIDLFKIVSSLKFLLKLPNYKQKTIEAFLGIDRKDMFDGGQLIEVYRSYVHQPSDEQMYFLKQHNYEDVLGMLDLLPVLSYSHLFKGEYTFLSVESNVYKDFNGQAQKELIFTLKNTLPIPKQVSYGYQEFYLTCDGSNVKLSVKLYDGALKYFYEDYKNYYYLPTEDIAVHKNIAGAVDKAYKKKATASTCYVRKTSLFLPQYQMIAEPAFYKERKDKVSYFELSEDFIASEQLMTNYINHILALMEKQKH